MTTLFVLVSTPSPPQLSVEEQLLQGLHSVGGGSKEQLHASKLQLRGSVKVSRVQGPQPRGTSLVRRDLPPSHEAEQAPQLDHSVANSGQSEDRCFKAVCDFVLDSQERPGLTEN